MTKKVVRGKLRRVGWENVGAQTIYAIDPTNGEYSGSLPKMV